MFKRLIAVLVVILAVALGLNYIKSHNSELAMQKKLEAIQAEIQPLQDEKLTLVNELKYLERQFKLDTLGTSTVQLVFTSADKQLYKDAYPIMERYELTGVIALSPNFLPGDNNAVTKKEFDAMLASGWSCCAFYDGGSDFDSWYESLNSRLNYLHIDMPEAVYFPADTYTENLNDSILSHGFSVAVHHGENRLPLLVENSGDSELWLPGACALNLDTVTSVSTAYSSRANLAYTISFGGYSADRFNKDSFSSCLRVISSYVTLGYTFQTDFISARNSFHENELHAADLAETLSLKEAAINSRLAEIEAEINSVYSRYNLR